MTLLAVLLVLAAAILALLGARLVHQGLDRERARLAHHADEKGWDHTRPTGQMENLLPRVLPSDAAPGTWRIKDEITGPTIAGPFRLARVRTKNAPAGNKDLTIIHIRTPLSSPGLHIRPASGFRAAPQGAGSRSDRYHRLYRTTTADPGFLHQALDPDTREYIATPRRTVRLDWLDNDLVIAIPLAARTPRAIDSLMAWSAALADRLNTPTPRPWRPTTTQTATAATERPQRLPEDIDLMMP
jgi:hypothetical protein